MNSFALWAGRALLLVGGAVLVVGSVVSTILSIKILAVQIGFWAVVLGLFLFPVIMAAVPLYAGFALNDWMPLLIGYGSMLGGGAICVIGQTVLASAEGRSANLFR